MLGGGTLVISLAAGESRAPEPKVQPWTEVPILVAPAPGIVSDLLVNPSPTPTVPTLPAAAPVWIAAPLLTGGRIRDAHPLLSPRVVGDGAGLRSVPTWCWRRRSPMRPTRLRGRATPSARTRGVFGVAVLCTSFPTSAPRPRPVMGKPPHSPKPTYLSTGPTNGNQPPSTTSE